MKKLFAGFIICCLFAVRASAADLSSLSQLFENNFDSFYGPRLCGQNISRLIQEAQKRKIDLSNSYVLKIVGAGFLETSGFYTRNYPQDRAMLGYFHMVLVADGKVFDFDLNEPLVLDLEDYVRLQFTPPHEHFMIWGREFVPKKELVWWKVTAFETAAYARGKENTLWSKKLGEFLPLESVMRRSRLR